MDHKAFVTANLNWSNWPGAYACACGGEFGFTVHHCNVAYST